MSIVSSLLFLNLAVAGGDPELAPLPERVMAEIDPARLRRSIDALAAFETRHSASETNSKSRGIGAARRWIRGQLEQASDESNGRMTVLREPFDAPRSRSLPKGAEMVNVLAILKGGRAEVRDQRSYVLAHYDSRASQGDDARSAAPGANDNGSGTALVLELARVLADERLDSTVVFLLTAGEEQGLFGAHHHVEQAVEAGLVIRGALNNDIVGDPGGPADGQGGERTDRGAVRLFAEGLPAGADERTLRTLRTLSSSSDSSSRQLGRFVVDVARRYRTAVQPRMVFRHDRFLRGGDHLAFNLRGLAAVRFTEVFENFHRQHQDVREEEGVLYGDRAEFVDENYLADVTRLNAVALIALANAPAAPAGVRFDGRGLSADTSLTWAENPEEDLGGYEVVWRDTTSPDWEHVRDVGEETRVTLPLSRDNWFFAVRAYDQEGYRSPATLATLGRRR